jgi:hypothetical protein
MAKFHKGSGRKSVKHDRIVTYIHSSTRARFLGGKILARTKVQLKYLRLREMWEHWSSCSSLVTLLSMKADLSCQLVIWHWRKACERRVFLYRKRQFYRKTLLTTWLGFTDRYSVWLFLCSSSSLEQSWIVYFDDKQEEFLSFFGLVCV